MSDAYLITNGWLGKALGVVIALVVSPPTLLAIPIAVGLGLTAGHVFDIWGARAQRSDIYSQFLFTALGRLAKAKGVVAAVDIDYAERLFTQLRLPARQRRAAIGWFDAGKNPDVDIAALVHIGAEACAASRRPSDHLRVVCARCLIDAAHQDGAPAAVTDAALAELLALIGVSYEPRLPGAFQTLGLDLDATFEEAQLAYRRLVRQYHPDASPNADEDTIRRAQRKLNHVREAFETIKAQS